MTAYQTSRLPLLASLPITPDVDHQRSIDAPLPRHAAVCAQHDVGAASRDAFGVAAIEPDPRAPKNDLLLDAALQAATALQQLLQLRRGLRHRHQRR